MKLKTILSGLNLLGVPQCEFCCGSGSLNGATCLRCLGTGMTVDHEDEEGYFDEVDRSNQPDQDEFAEDYDTSEGDKYF